MNGREEMERYIDDIYKELQRVKRIQDEDKREEQLIEIGDAIDSIFRTNEILAYMNS